MQIAGREPGPMAEAARLLEGQGARVIDINMGCPAKKVTGGLSGAALMRDPDQALRLIEATVGATSVPVTLKMRLGWDDGRLNAPEIARRGRRRPGSRWSSSTAARGRSSTTAAPTGRAIAAVKRAVRDSGAGQWRYRRPAAARAALAPSGAAG